MDRPHVLVLAPGGLAVQVPADQAVHVDEGMAVDDDAADRDTGGIEVAAVLVSSCQRDAGDPAFGGMALDGAFPRGEADRAPISAQEAVGDAVVSRPPGGHGEEAIIWASGSGDVGRA